MDAKLTLRLDKDIIEKIKIYAAKEHLSLSDLTENLYKSYLVNSAVSTQQGISSPIAKKYKSIISSSDFDYDDLKVSYLSEKHVK